MKFTTDSCNVSAKPTTFMQDKQCNAQDDSHMVIEPVQDDSKYDAVCEPGCDIIDSCRIYHCLCKICTVAPWCGTDCANCAINNFTERKVKCKDFCPDKYMINYLRQIDDEDDMIISDRVSMKALARMEEEI